MPVRIKTAYLYARAASGKRPAGYLEDVLSRGTVDGDEIVFEDAAYTALAEKYRMARVPAGDLGVAATKTPRPGLGKMALTLAKASARFAASGFRQVRGETLTARKAVCGACPDWDPTGYAGLGRCRKCGCSGVKLSWASERCPLGKWEVEASLSPG